MTISLYQQHVQRWHDCECCTLWETRKSVVFARGVIPCDVLLVGEGPGESEDVLGSPFVGPAGHLLNDIVARAIPSTDGYLGGRPPLRIAFTNLICCIPRDPEQGGKASEPPVESIQACKPRLEEFIGIARPKLLVAVGTVARDWFDQKQHKKYRIDLPVGLPVIDIHHPAYILRANQAQRGLLVQRCVVQIANAVEKYLDVNVV